VAWLKQKLNWKFGILLFDWDVMVMCFRMIFSRILPMTCRRLTSLYEVGFSGGLPGLRTLKMIDNFQVVVK